MRVLVTTPLIDKPGGVANYYKTLRPHLPVEVEYFTVGARADTDARLAMLIRLFCDYLAFFRELRRGGCDLVHLNPSLVPKAIVRDAIFLLIAKSLGTRVIVFFRGWDAGCENFIRKYCLTMFRFVYNKADAFIVLAMEFKEAIADMGFTAHVFLETTVVADEVFESMPVKCERSGFERSEMSLNILTLTRIEKTKGVYETIDAYRELKERYPLLTLTIAGDGRDLPAIKQYVQDLEIPDIDFPGFVRGELKRRTFNQADIYVLPTTCGEGMPNSVLEAMASGLPIVTRPVGGIRDYFENGRMGFLTESLDPKVFAALMEPLIVDDALRRTIGAFNRDYARTHFRASDVASRLQAIYRKVMMHEAVG